MRLVSEAAESLLSCTTLPETLDRILSLVFDNIPVERGVICLLDPESGSIEPMAMRNREGVPDVPMTISTNITGVATTEKAGDPDPGHGDGRPLRRRRECDPDGDPLGDVRAAPARWESQRIPLRRPSIGESRLRDAAARSTLDPGPALRDRRRAGSLRDDVRREQERRVRLARYSSPAVVERILEAPSAGSSGMVATRARSRSCSRTSRASPTSPSGCPRPR